MEKRTQRSPQELIAEQQAKLERMQLRQAQADAKSNPALSPLMDEKGDLAKEIEKHEAWISKIEAERFAAEDVLTEAESSLESLNAEINTKITALAATPKEMETDA